VHRGYWWGNLKEIAIGRPGVDERIIMKCNFRNWSIEWDLLAQ